MTKFKIGDVIKSNDNEWQDKRIVDITDDDYMVELLGNDYMTGTVTNFTIDYIDTHYQLKDEHSEEKHSEEKQPTYTYSIYRIDRDEFEEFEGIVSEIRTDMWLVLTDIDGDKYEIRAEVVTSLYIVKDSE